MNFIKGKFSKTFCFGAGVIVILSIPLIYFTYPVDDLEILESLRGPVSPFDTDLLKITFQKFLYPPSNKPYNLMLLKSEATKKYFVEQRKFYKSWNTLYETLKILYPKGSQPGFFVEAGAYDGELFSNSLYLELKLGWTGLLVEPSKINVKNIFSKNRKVWVSPCCLAVKPHPHKTFLQLLSDQSVSFDSMNSLVDSKTSVQRTQYSRFYYEEVQCLPLQTLLKALNKTQVDLISLDVEDVEEDVLRNFSWNEINVDVWLVEHRHPDNKFLITKDKEDPEFIKWFNDKGYIAYKIFVLRLTDYVFIKKDSEFYKKNRERLKLQ